MKYTMNTTGVEENKGFTLIDEATYDFIIAEKSDLTTKNGDPMVNIKLTVAGGKFDGKPVWDNIVIPTGPDSLAWGIMGRTKHFLHMIGEPYEGAFDTDSDRWVWKKVRAKVKHETQKFGKYAGEPRAIIAEYLPLEEGVVQSAPRTQEPAGKVADEDVPF